MVSRSEHVCVVAVSPGELRSIYILKVLESLW